METITSISRILNDEGIEQSKLVLMPLINEPCEIGSQKKIDHKMNELIRVLDLKMDAIDRKDFNADCMSQYSGSAYPSYSELKRVRKLMEFVRDNYTCVQPLDENLDAFSDRMMTMEQLKHRLLEGVNDS